MSEHDEAAKQFTVADDEIATGAPLAALQMMQERLARHPDDVPTLIRLGNANTALGRNVPAELFFQKALAINPGSLEARMGLVHAELDHAPQTALSDLQALAADFPNDAKIRTDFGVAYDLCNQPRNAQEQYRLAMGDDPTMISPQVNLGLSLALSGDTGQAMSLLAPLALSGDSTPRIRQDYAVVQTLAGHEDRARAILATDLPAEKIDATISAYRMLASHAH